MSEFEFSKYSPISSGKSLKALRLNVRYCAQNAQTFSKEIQYPSYWEALVDFSADKMYFPPNKSIKPNFINFIVEIQENAFSNPGFNQVPQALKQTMKSNSKYILYFTFSSFFFRNHWKYRRLSFLPHNDTNQTKSQARFHSRHSRMVALQWEINDYRLEGLVLLFFVGHH